MARPVPWPCESYTALWRGSGLWEDPQDAERLPPWAGPNRVGFGDLFYEPDPDYVPFADFPEDGPIGTEQ